MEATKEQNIFPTKFKLVSFYEDEWNNSKKILLDLKSQCQNKDISLEEKFQKLSEVIINFEKLHGNEDYGKDYLANKCMNLNLAIKFYFKKIEENFYTDLLPFIIEQSLLIEERAKNKYGEQTLPLMPSGKAMKESIPKLLFLSIISNNFFCNHKDVINQLNSEQIKLTKIKEWNIVNWYKLYNLKHPAESYISTQRIVCLIAFFDFAKRILDSKNNYFEKDIIVERIIFNPDDINKKLSECQNTFEEKDIFIHTNDMDNPGISTQSLVNFANRNFQTGRIIASCTQEEVLFCVRPELFMAMFICQRVYENEIIIISNAYKLMENTGYLNTFKFKCLKENIFSDNDFYKNDNENILCLDATFMEHYSFNSVLQDFSKFYMACDYCSKNNENPGISTGSWGCGAFYCDKAHKFLQQLVCGKACGVKLSYSTFGDQKYKNKLEKLFKAVLEYTPKVCDLYKLIIDFKGKYDKEFHKYLKEKLGDEFNMEEDAEDVIYKLFMNA